MGLFQRGSPEERFWEWFARNSGRLLRFEQDQEGVFRELGEALNRVHKGLTFEFGPLQDGRREFVISADGIRDHFPAVRRLVAAAPALPDWIIIPFRPPKSLDCVLDFGGHRLGSEDIWFTAEPDGGRVGLSLFIRGLTEDNRQTLGGAGFILLDNALGGFAPETQVGFIQWRPRPEDPAGQGLRPLKEIRDVFDLVKH